MKHNAELHVNNVKSAMRLNIIMIQIIEEMKNVLCENVTQELYHTMVQEIGAHGNLHQVKFSFFFIHYNDVIETKLYYGILEYHPQICPLRIQRITLFLHSIEFPLDFFSSVLNSSPNEINVINVRSWNMGMEKRECENKGEKN